MLEHHDPSPKQYHSLAQHTNVGQYISLDSPTPPIAEDHPAIPINTTDGIPAARHLLAGLVSNAIAYAPGAFSHQGIQEASRESLAGSNHHDRVYPELRNRWDKVSNPCTTPATPQTGQAFYLCKGGNSLQDGTVQPGDHRDTVKVMDCPRSTTRWISSQHRRTASDADLHARISNDDDASVSSGHESVHRGTQDTTGAKRCLVCDDLASGYHYGVSSCEACKAFFKRTIQGNIEYACPAVNVCPIDKRRRKACQACRYKKCLRVGMLKEGVRLDRVRGGRQKYRRANNGDPIMVHTPLSQRNAAAGDRRLAGVPELSQLLASLTRCEPCTSQANITLDGSVNIQSALCDLADRDLVGIVGWAKQVPGFSELPLNDQMHLLQQTWCEILLFGLCFRSTETTQSGILQFAEDFLVDETMAKEAGFELVHSKACRLVDALKSYRLCREEYMLIKCIILLNGGCVLENNRICDALLTTIVQFLHQFVDATTRASNLLILLPQLRQTDGLAKQYWFTVKREAKVTLHKLFLEMLESSQQIT